jgi:hypothetical protein
VRPSRRWGLIYCKGNLKLQLFLSVGELSSFLVDRPRIRDIVTCSKLLQANVRVYTRPTTPVTLRTSSLGIGIPSPLCKSLYSDYSGYSDSLRGVHLSN